MHSVSIDGIWLPIHTLVVTSIRHSARLITPAIPPNPRKWIQGGAKVLVCVKPELPDSNRTNQGPPSHSDREKNLVQK